MCLYSNNETAHLSRYTLYARISLYFNTLTTILTVQLAFLLFNYRKNRKFLKEPAADRPHCTV